MRVPNQDLALGNWVERRREAGLVLKIGSCGSMWLEMAGPFDNLISSHVGYPEFLIAISD